ncbi:MAG: chromate transporter [Betaproteobacteria bacterium]
MDSTPPLSPPVVSTRALFFRFLEVGLSGFGGVLPFAHRMMVEQRRWLSEAEFAEVLSISQFLPGPNIVNVAVMVGRRFQGPKGAFAAVLGLMLMPMVIVLALALVYARFADVERVRHAFNGIAAAASGLVLAMGLKMARATRGSLVAMAIAAVSFVAIGIARWPLLWVLAVMAPVSIVIAWMRRAR